MKSFHNYSNRTIFFFIVLWQDWEGNVRYAQYKQFTLSNEINSYRLFVGNYTGNTGRDSLRYHNNTAFSTKDKDNDKCVDDCAQFRKGKTCTNIFPSSKSCLVNL